MAMHSLCLFRIPALWPLLLATLLFVSCDDPLPDSDDDEEETEVETSDDSEEEGTEILPDGILGGDTLSVAQLQDYYNLGYESVEAIVKGYIVGVVSGLKISTAQFEGTFTTVSNLLLADAADEADYNYCVPVQLISGTSARTCLNLADNPSLLGRKLAVAGTLETYFLVAGIKDLTDYRLYDETTTDDTTTDNNENTNEGNADNQTTTATRDTIIPLSNTVTLINGGRSAKFPHPSLTTGY